VEWDDNERAEPFSCLFIELPENPRLSSLGMNGARSEAE
jgi:hypothetical protein